MTLHPAELVKPGLLLLQAAMLVVVALSLPMHKRRPGLEMSVMIMCMLALGPLGSLFEGALRDRSLIDVWMPWADFGLLFAIVQTLFWICFWQMRRNDRNLAKPPTGNAA